MRFLFGVTRHSAFVRISINTSQGFTYSAHNLLETRQFRPQLGEFFRLFREVILVATNPMRQIAEFFVWHFGMALFRPRSGRSSRVLVVPNYHQIVIQNENYQRRQRNRQSLRVLVRFNRVASVIINRADHSAAELAGVETVSQWWIPTGEQSDCRRTSGRRKAFRCSGIGESLDCLLQCSDGRAAPFRSFGSVNRTRSCARTTQHAGQASGARIVTKRRRRRPPDAQLSAPALRLPTPRATG